MRPVTPPLPAGDHLDSPRLVLRDGSVASVRPATPEDRDELRRFFHDLSPESRRRRFFGTGDPPSSVIEALAQSADPTRHLTLIVHRFESDDAAAEDPAAGTSGRSGLRPIAVASYIAATPGHAEVAFAVADHFQGRGLSTVLLERLAAVASRHGIEKFQASTLIDNLPMLEVFRDSGFGIRSKTQAGVVELQLSLAPSAAGVHSAEERERLATARSLEPLLTPRGIAVIGVSRDPSGLGRHVFDALRRAGFAGPIHPVHPEADEIDGVRCIKTPDALPAGTDLAVIAVPAAAVPRVVDGCAAAGVMSLVVISAGFAESGEAGRARELALVERVRNHGMRMVGPNCMGVLNAGTRVRMNASFSPIMPPAGRIGLLSQSGALGIAILELASARQIGLSSFVSVGNKADVSGNDLLQYWEGDPETQVLLLYLESFGNPRRFARLARRIARTKPIVAVKAGRTRAGSRAAGSHTGALAASDVTVDALLHQSGVLRADTIDELFDIAACLDMQPLPAGRRVAIVTNAGGPGILAADACTAAGLQVVEFGAATRDALAQFLPPEASIGNPVDLVASAGADAYRRSIVIAMMDPDVDALIVVFTPIDPGESPAIVAAIREGIAEGRHAGAAGKTVVACVMSSTGERHPLEITNRHDGGTAAPAERVPTYVFPENAARAVGKIASYAEWRQQPPALYWTFDDLHSRQARDICHDVVAERGDTWLTPNEARRVLDACGIQLVPTTVARDADAAVALAASAGYPVVAKVLSRHLLHKSEAGGVRVSLTSEDAVRAAFQDLTTLQEAIGAFDYSAGEGVAIQPMIAGGVELMIGTADDPVFGALVAFGLGGIHVEVFGDVGFRVAPLTDRDVDELIHGIRGVKLLQGVRGRAPADLDAVRELLLRVARLAEDVPEIRELDLNPVIALAPGQGCRIVDARIRVASPRDTLPGSGSRPFVRAGAERPSH